MLAAVMLPADLSMCHRYIVVRDYLPFVYFCSCMKILCENN